VVPAREMWVVAGRWGGKSLIAALIAFYVACFRRGHVPRDPSGWAVVVVLAADREQAKVVLRYVAGLIEAAPMLAKMVHSRTAEAIHLRTGVSIEVHTANFRSIRGRTILAAICDEIAFWRSEESANPDKEIVNAIKPAMMTVPGGCLLLGPCPSTTCRPRPSGDPCDVAEIVAAVVARTGVVVTAKRRRPGPRRNHDRGGNPHRRLARQSRDPAPGRSDGGRRWPMLARCPEALEFEVKEGEASIFKPEGGGYKLVAQVQMDEWPRIAAAK
jgi:hypothetical protein